MNAARPWSLLGWLLWLLRLLLLLLLLHFALALLHHLHALLGSHGAVHGLAGRALDGGRLVDLRRLFRLGRLIVLFLVLRLGARVGLGGAGGAASALARAENDVERKANGLVADDEDVVIGAVEELGEDIAGLPGSVVAEDALIVVEAIDLGAGLSGDLIEDGGKAGVLGDDVKALAVVRNVGRGGGIVDRPLGLRRQYGRGWDDRRLRLCGSGFAGCGATMGGLVRGLLRRVLGCDEGGREAGGEAEQRRWARERSAGATHGRCERGVRRLVRRVRHEAGFMNRVRHGPGFRPGEQRKNAHRTCVLD